MKKKTKVQVAAMLGAICGILSACGSQDNLADARPTSNETVETLAVITSASEQATRPATEPPVMMLAAAEETTTEATEATTTTEATEAPTDATEDFVLTDTEVADKMHEYFSEKGYDDAQIAGIVGNAEIESGLEPSRGVPGGGFGLFQLMDCPQRREMLAAFDEEGVGKYATSDYWSLNASDFDTEEDFDKFMTVMLDFTMNEDDPAWMNELRNANSPEEASEVFLVHYERAVNGGSPIEYYSPYAGRYYQATSQRREAARRWYDYFTA